MKLDNDNIQKCIINNGKKQEKIKSNDGKAVKSQYVVSKLDIGKGTLSTVFECKNIYTGIHYAIKKYSKRIMCGMEDLLENEIQVLKKVSRINDNISTLIDYFETKNNYFFVMELEKGGELYDFIMKSKDMRLSESQVKVITKTLIKTIGFLHKNNVVHRDIKSENILLKNKILLLKENVINPKDIIISDFGLAKIVKDQKQSLFEIVGTLSFMAPEIFNKSGYSMPIDIWALGVMVYYMLSGYTPFDCETDEQTRNAIVNNDYDFEPLEYWNFISVDAKDFIKQCLNSDSLKRKDCDSLLNHSFFNDNPVKLDLSSTHINISDYKKLKILPNNRSFINVDQVNNSKFINVLNRELLKSGNLSETELNQEDIVLDKIQNFSPNSLSKKNYNKKVLQKLKFLSFIDELNFKTNFCKTPDQVSEFNTPATSTNVSRHASSNDILKSINHKNNNMNS